MGRTSFKVATGIFLSTFAWITHSSAEPSKPQPERQTFTFGDYESELGSGPEIWIPVLNTPSDQEKHKIGGREVKEGASVELTKGIFKIVHFVPMVHRLAIGSCPPKPTQQGPLFGPDATQVLSCVYTCPTPQTCELEGGSPATDGPRTSSALGATKVEKRAGHSVVRRRIASIAVEATAGGTTSKHQWTLVGPARGRSEAEADLFFFPITGVESRYEVRLNRLDSSDYREELYATLRKALCAPLPVGWDGTSPQGLTLTVASKKLETGWSIDSMNGPAVCPSNNQKFFDEAIVPELKASLAGGTADFVVSFQGTQIIKLILGKWGSREYADAYVTDDAFNRLNGFDINQPVAEWAKGVCLVPKAPINDGSLAMDADVVRIIDKAGRPLVTFVADDLSLTKHENNTYCAKVVYLSDGATAALRATHSGQVYAADNVFVSVRGVTVGKELEYTTVSTYGVADAIRKSYVAAGVTTTSKALTGNPIANAFVVRAQLPAFGLSVGAPGKWGATGELGISMGLLFGSRAEGTANGLSAGLYGAACFRAASNFGARGCIVPTVDAAYVRSGPAKGEATVATALLLMVGADLRLVDFALSLRYTFSRRKHHLKRRGTLMKPLHFALLLSLPACASWSTAPIKIEPATKQVSTDRSSWRLTPKDCPCPSSPSNSCACGEDRTRRPREISRDEEGLVERAFAMANAVVQSPCFEKEVLSREKALKTRGIVARDVLDKMRTQSSVKVTLYDGSSKHGTIGWHSPDEPGHVHANRHFIGTSEVLASNLLHEFSHVLGYDHRSPKDLRSVPYSMNTIFDTCLRQIGLEAAVSQGFADEQPEDD